MKFVVDKNNQIIDLDPGPIDYAESARYLTVSVDFLGRYVGFEKVITFINIKTGKVEQKTLVDDAVAESEELLLDEGDWSIEIAGTLGGKTFYTLPFVKHANPVITADGLPIDVADNAKVSIVELADSIGASLVGVADAGGYYNGSNVESVLQEVGETLDSIVGAGVLYNSGLVTSAQSTPDMTVAISTGTAFLPSGERVTPTAVASQTITTADATNPRKDITYVNSSGVIAYLAGTASVTPTAPSLPSGGVLLAEIYVGAGVTSITNANITDRRTIIKSNAELVEDINGINLPALGDTIVYMKNYASGNATDETTGIQQAIDDSVGKTLYWNRQTGTKYITDELIVPSNIHIIFEPDTIVEIKTGLAEGHCFFWCYQVQNIIIEGNKSTLQMLKSEYTSGETRHCFYIANGCNNIKISGLEIKDSGADGIFIGGTSAMAICYNIVVEDCIVTNNRRNNIAIVFASDVIIRDCELSYASGTSPQAGIDIEPNTGTTTSRILLENIYSHHNTSNGFIFALGADDVIVNNCRSMNNGGHGYSHIGTASYPVSNIRIYNSIAKTNARSAYFEYCNNCIIDGCEFDGNSAAIQSSHSSDITISRNIIKNTTGDGILITHTTRALILNNKCMYNTASGIRSSYATDYSLNLVIDGNYCEANYQLGSGTYTANIWVGGSTDAVVKNNVVRKGNLTNKPSYGIEIDSDADGTIIMSNDCFDGGATVGLRITDTTSVNCGNVNLNKTFSTTAG